MLHLAMWSYSEDNHFAWLPLDARQLFSQPEHMLVMQLCRNSISASACLVSLAMFQNVGHTLEATRADISLNEACTISKTAPSTHAPVLIILGSERVPEVKLFEVCMDLSQKFC